jgi:hypothetical protein
MSVRRALSGMRIQSKRANKIELQIYESDSLEKLQQLTICFVRLKVALLSNIGPKIVNPNCNFL